MDNPINPPTIDDPAEQRAWMDLDWSTVDLSPGARVARGVLYIDRAYPNTLAYLHPNLLDIGSCTDCVLGQIHDDYVSAPECQLGIAFLDAHGFRPMCWSTEPGADDELRTLNDLWRKAIYAARDRA